MTHTVYGVIVHFVPGDATYMREYRTQNPDAVAVANAANRARSRALRKLAGRYPVDFKAILNEERRVEGLPPVGVTKRGRKPKEAAA